MSTERRTQDGRDEETNERACASQPCERSNLDRRRVLVSIGGVGTVAVAGCMGLFEESETEDDEQEDDEPEDEPTDDEPEDETEEATVYDIEFLEFDETLDVADDEALLYAALDEGWEMEYACESGTCGQCTARVDGDAGDVITHDGNEYLTDEQIEDGWLLTCVGYPDDDFALETNIHPDDEDDGTYSVEFLEFDETLDVADDQELLYAALDEGWEMEYSCESGRCGQCTARVDGDANDVISHEENHYLEDEQIEDGWLLTCTARAEDEFALETNIHPDD